MYMSIPSLPLFPKIITLLFFLKISSALTAHEVDMRNDMRCELNHIEHVLRVMYAPAEWKRKLFGWDRIAEYERVNALLSTSQAPISTRNFRFHLQSFISSTQDYHTSITFFSTENTTLPFDVKAVQERVFFSSVHDDAPKILQEGDELLSIDGIKAYDAIVQLKSLLPIGASPQTDLSLAAIILTRRFASKLHPIPKGEAIIEVSHLTGETGTYAIPWNYHSEEIPYLDEIAPLQKQVSLLQSPLEAFHNANLLKKLSLIPFYTELSPPDSLEKDKARGIGAKKSFVPNLGQILWHNAPEQCFHAYLYTTPSGRRLGYIRIPRYRVERGGFKELLEFAELINYFENNSEGLIIDQVDNPGGHFLYMLRLAALLANKPMNMLTKYISITPKEVHDCLEMLVILHSLSSEEKELIGPAYTELKEYSEFIVDQWRQGNTLTRPTYLLGIKNILPDEEVHYSKPIVMLVNELAFSCGDIMPALFKDNGRAQIFGTRTAGAGGSVERITFPSRTGFASLSYTTSLTLRENGLPLENLGVTPDIGYELTTDDLRYGYKGYAEQVNYAMEALLNIERQGR